MKENLPPAYLADKRIVIPAYSLDEKIILPAYSIDEGIVLSAWVCRYSFLLRHIWRTHLFLFFWSILQKGIIAFCLIEC